MLNAQGFAQLVKLMIAARPTLTRGKQTVSEFFAVVRQQLDDLDGARFVQRIQEGFGTGGCFVSLDGYKDLARGPVDSHKQIAPFGLIGHLRQVLDIQVQIPFLLGLKCFVSLFRLGWL